jgi:hypothetical protein
LPVCFSYTGQAEDGRPLGVRVGPFRHAVGYLAAGGEVINLLNFEAGTGYFPVLYRPEVNPYHHLPSRSRPAEGLLEETLHMDIAGYTARTGQPINYVLLWGLRPGERPGPRAQFILRQLEGDYEPVYQSPQRGLLQLYRRKDPDGSHRASPAP